MDGKIIQKRVDDIAAAMLAKGLRTPHVQAEFRSNRDTQIYVKWKSGIGRSASLGDDKYKFFNGDMAECLEKAAAFIAKMPTPEQAKLQDFMAAVGEVIDLGRKHDIAVEFLNPLTDMMKRLSENALTDKRAA